MPTIMKIVNISNERSKKDYPYPTINVFDGKTIYSDEVVLHSSQETIVHLSTPIAVRPGFKYDIVFTISLTECYTKMTLKSKVKLEQGIEIEFHEMQEGGRLTYGRRRIRSDNDQGLIRQLIFMKSD